jgi:penicillin-binding protein 2
MGYSYDDQIGKAGLEKQYESSLRGANGQEYVEVNAYGKRMGSLADMPRVEPLPGLDAYMTLDADLQRVADSVFSDTLRGAVVALDPRNGEVLVMFSSPAVDPNIFSYASWLRAKYWVEAATDPNQPLNNRAVYGTYTPGSTFKLVSALAGLATGKLTENSLMPKGCTGGYKIGNRFAKCWYYPKGHGHLTLLDAVKHSCNVYFYQVGLLLGDKAINSYAALLGLGEPTGIDLPQERSGWISGEELYNKKFASRNWVWTPGLVLDLAIGQSQVATPVQLAVMAGALGNGSVRYRPFLLKEFRTSEGLAVRQTQPVVAADLNLSPDVVASERAAMKTVLESGGTGTRAAVKGITVGGKTGSAQNPQGDLTHALFVACAPLDSPSIAVSVVVENAGHGGSVAAPIAGAVLRYYFEHTREGRRVAGLPEEEEVDTVKTAADSIVASAGTGEAGGAVR